MRSYIFTERERKLILKYLYTPIEVKPSSIKHVKSRVRNFTKLPEDIELYFRLIEAMKMDQQIIESLRV